MHLPTILLSVAAYILAGIVVAAWVDDDYGSAHEAAAVAIFWPLVLMTWTFLGLGLVVMKLSAAVRTTGRSKP